LLTSNSAQASISLLNALPTNIQSLILVDPTSAGDLISDEFASASATGGVPSWFTSLPTEVQTYFLTIQDEVNTTSTKASTATGAGSSIKNSVPRRSLSSGEIVAIVVPVLGLILCIATVVTFLAFRRKRKWQLSMVPTDERRHWEKPELDSNPVVPPVELPADIPISEMPGALEASPGWIELSASTETLAIQEDTLPRDAHCDDYVR
jgi:hypothetical protein